MSRLFKLKDVLNDLKNFYRFLLVLINSGLVILFGFAAFDQTEEHSAFMGTAPANMPRAVLAACLLIVTLAVIYFLTYGWAQLNQKLAIILTPLASIALAYLFLRTLLFQ